VNCLKQIWILVLLCVSLTAFAQQKEAEQLNDLYIDGSYEKCIKKAQKYTETYPKKYQFPLYVAACYWQLYKTDKATNNLMNALAQLKSAHDLYGKKIGKFAAEQKQIHVAAIQIGPGLLKAGDNDGAKALYGYLATVYKDTTEEYTWLYPSSKNTTKITIAGANVLVNEAPTLDPDHSANSSLVDKLILYSTNFLGLPYRYAGCEPSTGFDCSGFVSYLYKKLNIKLPHSSQELSYVGSPVPLAMVKPGDLLFYGTRKGSSYRTQHVAMVYSNTNGKLAFIHSSTSQGVVIDDPESASWDYWEKRFLFAKRVL
jgi:cell wall-associated NlpC family hydrolase